MISISKRSDAPQSLAIEKEKKNGSYSLADVVTALVEDSFGKCYICEDTLLTSINVEHFREHRGDKDKKFDWNNLHYACTHCNNTKNDTFRNTDSNLLNCADPRCKVDYWISYRIEQDSDFVTHALIEVNPDSDVTPFKSETENTVRLLDRVYNGTGTPIRNQESANLLKRVLSELLPFKQKLLEFIMEKDLDLKAAKHNRLMDLMSEKTPFVAFKRWIIRDNNLSECFGL